MTTCKRMLCLILVICGMVSFICASAEEKASAMLPVEKITILDTGLSAVGARWKLKVRVEPENATNQDLIWSSSNEEVATVSPKGVFTGLSKGFTKITATATDGSGATATVTFRVDECDLVFNSPLSQKATYYIDLGIFHVSGRVRIGRVRIPDLEEDTYLKVRNILKGGSEEINVTPLRAGSDTIMVKSGGVETTISVFVSPDAFTMQNLGFGLGAVLEGRRKGVFNGHTYQVFDGKMTWTEAKKLCEAAGGHLATITSSGEQGFLRSLNDDRGRWIGLHKDDQEKWSWVTGEEVEYTFWAPWKPDNASSEEYPEENAALLEKRWDDYHENNTADVSGYICEWDSVTVEIEDKEGDGFIVEPGDRGIFNDHTYQRFSDKCSWTEAKEKCEAIGGHLATITSPAEQEFLEQLNEDENVCWIGLHRGEGDAFFWVTGENVSYTYWGSGEPNNSRSEDFPGEDAVAMGPKWNDCHGNNIANLEGYICEWDQVMMDLNQVEIKYKEWEEPEEDEDDDDEYYEDEDEYADDDHEDDMIDSDDNPDVSRE